MFPNKRIFHYIFPICFQNLFKFIDIIILVWAVEKKIIYQNIHKKSEDEKDKYEVNLNLK